MLGPAVYDDTKRKMQEFHGHYTQQIAPLLIETDQTMQSLQVFSFSVSCSLSLPPALLLSPLLSLALALSYSLSLSLVLSPALKLIILAIMCTYIFKCMQVLLRSHLHDEEMRPLIMFKTGVLGISLSMVLVELNAVDKSLWSIVTIQHLIQRLQDLARSLHNARETARQQYRHMQQQHLHDTPDSLNAAARPQYIQQHQHLQQQLQQQQHILMQRKYAERQHAAATKQTQPQLFPYQHHAYQQHQHPHNLHHRQGLAGGAQQDFQPELLLDNDIVDDDDQALADENLGYTQHVASRLRGGGGGD